MALTAYAMAEDRDRAYTVGCDDFETKPVNFPQLKAKIMARIEANFQVIKTQEMATLTLLRQLADGEFKTTTVVALPSDASPAVKTAPTASPAKR